MPEVFSPTGKSGSGVAFASPDDRQRLVDAATRLGVEGGYELVDPVRVASAAGLEVDDFQRHFANTDQCLSAGFDNFLERMREQIEEACEQGGDWPDRVRITIGSAFEFISELEPVARLFVVEGAHTGAAGVEQRCASISSAARWLKQGRELYPDAAQLPDALEPTLVSGVVQLASVHLLTEEADQLPTVRAEAVEMVLAPYLGSGEARRIAAV